MKEYDDGIQEAYDGMITEDDGDTLKITQWFMDNPFPKDYDVHKFAEKEGIDTHKFEGMIYGIISELMTGGRSKGKGEYDAEQMKIGTKIEYEHTTNKLIAEKIAKDHLAEYPTYYSALIEMEKKLEKETEGKE